jgi:cAMP phosphodiesterase
MLIDNDVLIDAGTGIGDLALEDLDSIRHVFLTHAHLDHVAGLPMLADRVFDENFTVPLTVYAREETLRAVQDHLFNDVIWPDFTNLPSANNPMLRYRICDPGDTVTRTNETLWPVLNACDDLKVLVIEVSFPDEMEELATESGHYCPRTLTRDLERLQHSPEIWLTGMKPGEEGRILEQVVEAAPGKNINMLSRGTILTV